MRGRTARAGGILPGARRRVCFWRPTGRSTTSHRFTRRVSEQRADDGHGIAGCDRSQRWARPRYGADRYLRQPEQRGRRPDAERPYAVTVSDADNYTVTASGNASSTATGGGFIDYSAAFRTGLVDATGEPGGYGTGDYGAGGYGGGFVATDILPLVWHLDNWGDNLLAVPRGGGLYEYQPATDAVDLVTNGNFASGAGWTLGTGWTIGSGVATAAAGSASDLSRPIALVAGKTYRVSLTVTRTAGTLVVKTNGGTMGEASSAVSVSGTYTRIVRRPGGLNATRCSPRTRPSPGRLTTCRSLATTAYRIAEAPSRNDAMFVDPNRIVVLIGTSLFGDVYNQMAIGGATGRTIASGRHRPPTSRATTCWR
jgi:hypothetical protein